MGSLTQLNLRHNLPAPQNHAATAARASRFACHNKVRLAFLPNRAQLVATKGSARIPRLGVNIFFLLPPETASFGLEAGANSSPNPAKYKPRSMRGPGLTFYDAASRFVT
jgi:hypothetical protein